MPIDEAVKRGCGEKEMPRLELGQGEAVRGRGGGAKMAHGE
jgi:hypothetical protein